MAEEVNSRDVSQTLTLLSCLCDRFSLEELKDIAFTLGVDFELFHHDTKAELSRELVSYFEQRNGLNCLISEVLRRRRDEQLAGLLTSLPPCKPFVKVQLLIGVGKLDMTVSELRQALAALFSVLSAEISLIAAAPDGDSLRLLIGLAAPIDSASSPFQLVTLHHPIFGPVHMTAFSSLDLISQKTWQLIACEYTPYVQGGKLQTAISWPSALQQISRPACAIYLAHAYTPSSLLYTESLPDFAYDLLRRAREYRETGNWEEAESCATGAKRYFEHAPDPAGIAIALMHLADIHRERGQTDLFLPESQEAYRLLQAHPALEQRHNEAVAAYNLGLVHYLLGNISQALTLHRTAQMGFQEARKELWVPHRYLDWAGLCKEMVGRLGAMNRALAYPAALPTKLVDSVDSTFSTGQFGKEDCVLGQKLIIDGNTFEVYTLNGSEVVVIPEGTYRLFPIPPLARLLVGAQNGDYMLAREAQKGDPIVTYYVAGTEGESVLGHFERDPENPSRLRFISIARVLGGAGKRRLHHLIALLRPVASPSV